MKISLIAAIASNGVIGNNGRMPWHLPADLRYFKQITLGAPILMGRKTFEAIGRALPERENIIISRNPTYQQPHCHTFTNIKDAVAYCQNAKELFIIGGATLYQAMLSGADYLYLTKIHKNFAGDVSFPFIDYSQWQELENKAIKYDQDVDFEYSFLKYSRVC